MPLFFQACDLFKQNAMQGVTKGGKDHDSTVDTTTKSGFFSAEETFHVEAIQRCLGRTEELSEELHSWFNNPWSVAETFHVGAIQRCLIANRCLKIATCQRVIESEETLTNVFEPWFNNPRSVALHPPKLPKVFHHLQVFCVLYTVTSTGLSTCCAFVYFLYSSYINTEPDKILLQNASKLAKNVTG